MFNLNFSLPSIENNNLNTPILEIFGIQIYFDDILIICILLFLYEEKIEDNLLFIALILLFLSWLYDNLKRFISWKIPWWGTVLG